MRQERRDPPAACTTEDRFVPIHAAVRDDSCKVPHGAHEPAQPPSGSPGPPARATRNRSSHAFARPRPSAAPARPPLTPGPRASAPSRGAHADSRPPRGPAVRVRMGLCVTGLHLFWVKYTDGGGTPSMIDFPADWPEPHRPPAAARWTDTRTEPVRFGAAPASSTPAPRSPRRAPCQRCSPAEQPGTPSPEAGP